MVKRRCKPTLKELRKTCLLWETPLNRANCNTHAAEYAGRGLDEQTVHYWHRKYPDGWCKECAIRLGLVW